MSQETVYTVGYDVERNRWTAYDLRGEVAADADTFGEAADMIRNRQQVGWLAPGPVWRQMPHDQP